MLGVRPCRRRLGELTRPTPVLLHVAAGKVSYSFLLNGIIHWPGALPPDTVIYPS